MEFKWTTEAFKEGQSVSSNTFEADNRIFKLSLTRQTLVYLTIEYIGTSYTDVITTINLDINGEEKDVTYTFNRYDTVFTFPVENSPRYTILCSFNIHPTPYLSRKETGFAGLRNLGATCYMNAFFQVLFHIKRFRAELFKQESKRKTFQIQKLFYKLTKDNDVDTRSFMNNCRWVDNIFTQEDIHEFAINVFHVLEDENKTEKEDEKIDHGKIDEDFFVDKLFKGVLDNYIKGECGCLSTTKSTFYDLSFEIRDWSGKQVARSITESLKQLRNEETLENENQYHCEKHGKVDAKKGVEISKLPPILLVLLKRFSMDCETFESSKINDFYEFCNEISFDLHKEAFDVSSEEKNKKALDKELLTPVSEQGVHPHLQDLGDDIKYSLFGVIVHSGGTTDGHYYCYIKPNGWYKFNDTVVTKVSEEEALFDNFGGINPYKVSIKSHSAYMLIYVDSSQWSEMVETPVEIVQSLIDKIKKSESGMCMTIQHVHRKDILGYRGVGLFCFDSDITLKDKINIIKVNSDDTLYIFEKNSPKKYVNIYNALTFQKMSIDDTVDENTIYFTCETNFKVSKQDVLVFVKKYTRKEECILNNSIDLELKACTYISKNDKDVEAIKFAMNVGEDYCFYIEEKVSDPDQSEESIEPECRAEINSSPIDTFSAKKERKILKKEINDYIEEKEQPAKKKNAERNKAHKYSLSKYDSTKTYKENNVTNGSIFICVNKDDEEHLINSYKAMKDRRPIKLIADCRTLETFVNQNYNFPGLLNFVHSYFACDRLEIVKFKGTVASNNIEEIKIKHGPEFTAIRVCNGIGVQDLNQINHVHTFFVESKVVRGLFRKISVIKCFAKDVFIDQEKKEFYSKPDVREEIKGETIFNKKIYDALKENYKFIEVHEGSPLVVEYETIAEYTGDGLLVLREKSNVKEVKMVRSDGQSFVGYPIILPLPDIQTVKDFRLHYGILTKLARHSCGKDYVLQEEDRVDNFHVLDVLVSYEG